MALSESIRAPSVVHTESQGWSQQVDSDTWPLGGSAEGGWVEDLGDWDTANFINTEQLFMGPSVSSSGFELSGMLLDHYQGKAAAPTAGSGDGDNGSSMISSNEAGCTHAVVKKETPWPTPIKIEESPLVAPAGRDDVILSPTRVPSPVALPPPTVGLGGVTLGLERTISVALAPAQAADFPCSAAAATTRELASVENELPRASRKRRGPWSDSGAEESGDESEAADGGRAAAEAAAAVVRRAVGRRAAAVAAMAVAGVDADDEGEEEEAAEEEEAPSDGERDLLQKRARNREHAKKSRMRKKVVLDGLEWELLKLRKDNLRLRLLIKSAIPEQAEQILRNCTTGADDAPAAATRVRARQVPAAAATSDAAANAATPAGATTSPAAGQPASGTNAASNIHGGCGPNAAVATSSEVDAFGTSWAGDGMGPIRAGVPSALHLMERGGTRIADALGASQQNLILTNPRLSGNPIVYASPGFLELTGYTPQQVVGRDWTLLRGPATDSTSVGMLSRNLEAGRDTSLCLLCYKADGTAFWNQMYMGALRDRAGAVVNFVGALCEVRQMPREEFRRRLHKVPLPDRLMLDYSEEAEMSGRGGRRRAGSASSAGGGSGKVRGGGSGTSDGPRRTRASARAGGR